VLRGHGKVSTFADLAVKGKHGVTCALGIDDAGVIVGYYRSAGSASHGFVYRNGKYSSITAPTAGKRVDQRRSDDLVE
jgi:probable HAF family extracellular repeat protein